MRMEVMRPGSALPLAVLQILQPASAALLRRLRGIGLHLRLLRLACFLARSLLTLCHVPASCGACRLRYLAQVSAVLQYAFYDQCWPMLKLESPQRFRFPD